jgi:hypothetical protein
MLSLNNSKNTALPTGVKKRQTTYSPITNQDYPADQLPKADSRCENSSP